MKKIRWDRCNVVGTVCDAASLRAASSCGSCDIVEIRADLFYPPSLPSILRTPSRSRNTESTGNAGNISQPTILTVRDECEGGAKNLSAEERTNRYLSHISKVSAIDIEIANIRSMRQVFKAARDLDIPVIASMHDFQRVPTRRAIAHAITRARDAGAACIKIAALTETSRELSKLVDCLDLVEDIPFALMGMGRFAFASRVLFMQCGSCLNYGSLGTATAPNQPSAEQLLKARSGA